MAYEIKFGTDGWRDVIGDGFTFANVKRAAQAACDVARKESKSRLILIGFDRRFFSDRFAEAAASVAAGNGFRVELASQPISSPTLSFHVHQRRAAMGFMITASHNPYRFNGFKLKGVHGGSVDESVTKAVEARLDISDIQTAPPPSKRADFIPAYLASVKARVKPSLARLKSPVVFDAMHGPGGLLFEQLTGHSEKAIVIRSEVDPLFGGVNPEPIDKNLQALIDKVRATKASAGIAVDGDVDRIGLVDDKGRYLPPHTVMPLLLLHLVEDRKLKGKVIQTVSMGYLPGRIAAHFKLPFEMTPVGFKYIAKKMLSEKVVLGGEESGGYGVGLWSPERDGLLCALLIIEMLAMRRMPLSAIVDDLYARFGASNFQRIDISLDNPLEKEAWTQKVAASFGAEVAGQAVKSVLTVDGVRLTLADDSWLLMRPSGTEPLLRTYSESPKAETVNALLAEAQRLAAAAVAKKPAVEAKKTKKRR
ncbi:MAG: phosphoglucomutase/phosphomannomutase family protein [Elusimicrobia bacterium]|nr:phosphoglucomutase/phosphomannomutase family protein [Elusimicrobiota bacterium]